MSNVFSIESILADCNVTDQTLPQYNRDELDELGFTVFPNVIDAEWLDEMRNTFEAIMAAEGE